MFTRFAMYSLVLKKMELLEEYTENWHYEELLINLRTIVVLMDGIEVLLDDNHMNLLDKYDSLIGLIDKNLIFSSEININSEIKLASYLTISEEISKKINNTKIITDYTIRSLIYNYLKFVTKYSEDIYREYSEELSSLIVGFKKNIVYQQENSFMEYYYSLSNVKYKGFFSYAYDDRLYTLGFFIHFLDNGILLYIDWIFNDKILNTSILKLVIDKVMKECDFLFFLRTFNSELSIKGNNQIRQWCSWEIGNYYQYSDDFKKRNKFFIDTIGNDKETNRLINNFTSISSISNIFD